VALDKSLETLLQDLEPLSHRARFARMVELGRVFGRGDQGAVSALEQLHKSPDNYHRLLALMSVFGSRHGAWVVEGLLDPSRSVRRRASRLVASFCSDEQIVVALESIIEKRILCRTLASLARAKKFAPVDAYLDKRMREAPEPFVIDILSLGSEALVRRHIQSIVEGGSFIAWERFCSRFPQFAARWFLEDLEKNPALDPRRRYKMTPALPELARRAPDTTLKIIEWLFQNGEEPYSHRETVRILVRSRPCPTFDMLKKRHQSGRPAHPPGVFGLTFFDAVANRLGPERLEYLVQHASSTLRDGKYGIRWFLRLSDSDKKTVLRAFLLHGKGSWGAFLFRYFKAETADEIKMRERAFDRWSRAAQGTDGAIAIGILDWLPRDLREKEARRHLERTAALTSKPEIRLQYAGLLSFEEAKQVLAPWLGHPEGEERARAQGILLSSVRHDPAALPDAIANVKARKFEQDPVRNVMFAALAQLRIAFFKKEHLESVGAIVDDALDAADLSSGTSAHVERLVVRLFRIDGFWAAGYMTKLLRVRGNISTWGIGDGLTNAEAENLSPALAHLLQIWATQERAGAIILLAQSLALRLRVVTPVLEGLERLARELPFVGVAAASLGLIYQYDRPRFAKIAPELLKTDSSYILVPHIAKFISLSRQDLLTPDMLAARPMQGRFATGQTTWVVDFQLGYARWTANQQQVYANALIALLKDESRPVPSLRFAISTLVRLAFADASVILPFASDPRQPVREMAIRGLPWLDARQGVPVLVEALADDRARWAIYALRKVFSEMRRPQVLAELRAVPTKKVTVAKEVVRLLGELGGEDAYQELLRLNTPAAHRDVRIAVLRALWDHLERRETWEIFEKAVQDPDWILASKLADIPLGRLSPASGERVGALLATILGRSEPEARIELLKRISSTPLVDERRSLWQRLVAHMGTDDPEEAGHAFNAVIHRMAPLEVDVVVKRLGELASRHRHLLVFLPRLSANIGPYASKTHTQVAKGFLTVLQSNPVLAPHYLTLGSRLWAYDDLVKVFIDLSKRDLLYHEVMEAAMAAVRACVHPGLVEEKLRNHSDWRIRRLALAALVQSASPKNGWTEERVKKLLEYQKDKAPGVAGPAQFVFLP
jgi:cellulose synthase operon protein C